MFLLLLFSILAFRPTAADTTVITEAHYRIYTPAGEAVTLDDVTAALHEVEVVFIGEEHNDPVAHYLEQALLRRAYARYGRVTLSLEMIERDVQVVLDEYLQGFIRARDLMLDSRPWSNYGQDYHPMVAFARERGIPVLAANAPRRYANLVARMGRGALDKLSEEARQWLPPLPYPEASPAYAARFEAAMRQMMHGHAPAPADTAAANGSAAHPPLHGTGFMLAAQVLRDAAMGHAIALHLMQRPDALVLHVNGSFHSEGGLGAPEQLQHYRPGTRTLILAIRPDEHFPDFDRARHDAAGDFIILTDPSLPRSFRPGFQD